MWNTHEDLCVLSPKPNQTTARSFERFGALGYAEFPFRARDSALGRRECVHSRRLTARPFTGRRTVALRTGTELDNRTHVLLCHHQRHA